MGKICHGKKSLNTNMQSQIDQDPTNDYAVGSVDDMDSVAYLDTMDSVANSLHVSEVDTMNFLPVWCTEFAS